MSVTITQMMYNKNMHSSAGLEQKCNTHLIVCGWEDENRAGSS